MRRRAAERTDRNATTLKSILLVDDDGDALELYSAFLKTQTTAEIACTRYPSEAAKLAARSFFDLVAIDATINYRGTPFGGLELYDLLTNRYGQHSLLLYSAMITDDLLKQYDYNVNFLERGNQTQHFVDRLVHEAERLRALQTCFVAMPFDGKLEAVWQSISAAVKASGYQCVRVDQDHFTASIVERVHTEIRRAKVVVFVATDRNPNAFYECGYAVSLTKEVITVTDTYSNLPFDVRDRNSIAYADATSDLKRLLSKRLQGLTLRGH